MLTSASTSTSADGHLSGLSFGSKQGDLFTLAKRVRVSNPRLPAGIHLENDHIVTKDGVDIYTTYPFDERLVNELRPLDTTTGRTR